MLGMANGSLEIVHMFRPISYYKCQSPINTHLTELRTTEIILFP